MTGAKPCLISAAPYRANAPWTRSVEADDNGRAHRSRPDSRGNPRDAADGGVRLPAARDGLRRLQHGAIRHASGARARSGSPVRMMDVRLGASPAGKLSSKPRSIWSRSEIRKDGAFLAKSAVSSGRSNAPTIGQPLLTSSLPPHFEYANDAHLRPRAGAKFSAERERFRVNRFQPAACANANTRAAVMPTCLPYSRRRGVMLSDVTEPGSAERAVKAAYDDRELLWRLLIKARWLRLDGEAERLAAEIRAVHCARPLRLPLRIPPTDWSAAKGCQSGRRERTACFDQRRQHDLEAFGQAIMATGNAVRGRSRARRARLPSPPPRPLAARPSRDAERGWCC
jgi:hypothetical protein